MTEPVAVEALAPLRVAESMTAGDPSFVANYQRDWEERFGKEFRLMRRLRHLYRHLSNDDLDKMVSALSAPSVAAKLSSTDFDFHASALLAALGTKLTLQLAGVLISAEAKQALSSLAQ